VPTVVALCCSAAWSSLAGSAAAGIERETRPLFPRLSAAIPVLLYHHLRPGGAYSVAPETFAAQMRRLHDLGFQTVTLDQYVRFADGDPVELPQRPLLITFDDGYASAWENADPVLARYGWSAVMYVPTGAIGGPGHLTWDELREMHASERWEIEEHAGDGHVLIRADEAGRRLPFYASEIWSGGTRESFSLYKKRVSDDIERGAALLARNLPGWKPHLSFAVPFNNYGHHGSNDPRIATWLSGYLERLFSVVFVQRDDSFGAPEPGLANRITVASGWTAGALEAHLRSGAALLTTPLRMSRPPRDQPSRHPVLHHAARGGKATAVVGTR
jgi:Polysaccharide deacetylase